MKRLNAQKAKMKTGSENTQKGYRRRQAFLCFCKKSLSSNSVFECIKVSVISCKLKEDRKLQSQTYTNQQTDVPKNCPGIKFKWSVS